MSNKINIIEKAVEEKKQLKEAAEKLAKDNLANEMVERFNELLKEAYNKKDSLNKKDPISEKENKDTTKEVIKENSEKEHKESNIENELDENIDLTQSSIQEIENEFDSANSDDEFQIQNDLIDLDQLTKELENLENIDAIDEPTETPSEEPITVDSEIETEVENDVEPEIEEDVNDPYMRIKKLIEEFNTIVSDMDDMKKTNELTSEFDNKMGEIYGEGYKESLGEKYEELKEMFINKQKGSENTPEETKPMNESENEEDKDEVINDEPINDDDKDDVDESHGVGLSQQKGVSGDQLPRPEYANYKKNKVRYALQKENWEKKMKGFIEENKKLTKKVNDLNESKAKANGLINEYSEVLKKYRTQLTEMAIFNTNLAHTNNLLVNEELSLNNNDKTDIINQFKNVSDINESEKLYNSLLENYKSNKVNISENIESKLTENITASSKNKLDEQIKEKTAYGSNKHIDKIKKTFKYIESK